MISPAGRPSCSRTALRGAAALAAGLALVELAELARRGQPVPPALPWTVLAVHAVLVPAALAAAALAGAAGRLIGRPGAGLAGPLWLAALLVAASAERRFEPVATAGAGILLLAGALAIDRRLALAGGPPPVGRLLAAAVPAGLLAKGTLLAAGGWASAGWAAVWLALTAGLLALPRGRRPVLPAAAWLLVPAALAALAAAVGWRPRPPAPVFPPGSARPGLDLVVVVLDTLRADFAGLADGPLARLPVWPAERRLALNAPSPSTLPSHASLFTGLPVHAHGAHQPFHDDPDPPAYAYRLPETAVTLAERLREAGYVTAAVSGNYAALAPEFGIGQGFDHYDARRNEAGRFAARQLIQRCLPCRRLVEALPGPLWGYAASTPYRPAEVVVDEALELLAALAGRRFFLFVNILDAHSPYIPPDYWRLRRTAAAAGWLHDGEPLATAHDAVVEDGAGLGPDETEFLRALYAAEVDYAAGQLARLLAALDRASTLVVILSDHGESLGEHSLLKHSSSLYGEQLDVPLVIGGPATAGALLERPITDFGDVHDLLLAAAGIEPPARPRPPGQVSQAYSVQHPRLRGSRRELFEGDLASLAQGPWKMIRGSDGVDQLFDLAADPAEARDLAAGDPGRARRMGAELEQYLALFPEARRQARQGTSGETFEALKALGYVR